MQASFSQRGERKLGISISSSLFCSHLSTLLFLFLWGRGKKEGEGDQSRLVLITLSSLLIYGKVGAVKVCYCLALYFHRERFLCVLRCTNSK